ncbi:MAG: GrpB family protein [Clostridium sp.]|nr:GrpB family protein [Clostridium sp.]
MKKKRTAGKENQNAPLSELSLEELWALFPVVLTEYRTEWKAWFLEERDFLLKELPQDKVVRISHVGSTAVGSIWAKPIVDILVELKGGSCLQEFKPLIEELGYICMTEKENRLAFNKGYTPRGFDRRVFHLHLRKAGDHDELYFRDYMQEHPEAAKEYEALKLKLWKKFEHNRDAYTGGKGELVGYYTKLAREAYGERYE